MILWEGSSGDDSMNAINPTTNDTTAAQERADAIRCRINAAATALAELLELVTQAYKAEDWRTLGYESWTDYVTREFGTNLIKLDLATRKSWTRSLKDAGMSTREIAPVTNAMQVSRDGRVTNVTPSKARHTDKEPKRADLKGIQFSNLIVEGETIPLRLLYDAKSHHLVCPHCESEI